MSKFLSHKEFNSTSYRTRLKCLGCALPCHFSARTQEDDSLGYDWLALEGACLKAVKGYNVCWLLRTIVTSCVHYWSRLMTVTGVQRRVMGFASAHQPRDFHFALGVALLAVVLHTYAQAAEFAKASEFRTLNSPTIPYIFLLIEIGLLVNVVGLWVQKTAGMLVSMAALLGVGIGYVVWYVYSRQILELLLSKSFYNSYPEAVPPHPLGLIGASWLHLVVLVLSVVLFVWELKTLRSMMAAKT